MRLRILGGHASTDGSFVFNLEADATISSEYIFLNHYLGMEDCETEGDLAKYNPLSSIGYSRWLAFILWWSL